MCGLFGVVRSPFAGDPGRASDVLVTLGMLAEERGTGSAGLALLGGWPGLGGLPEGRRVLEGHGRFSGVWRPGFLPELDRAPVALGHTRSVVPGSSGAEPILRRLAGRRTPSEVTGVLEAMAGRDALAWADRDRPTEVHLARGALSPLAVAVDTDQNIYWASEPRWFREVGRHTRVRFATVVGLHEGTYMKVGMERRPGRRDRPGVLATATFRPAGAPDTGAPGTGAPDTRAPNTGATDTGGLMTVG